MSSDFFFFSLPLPPPSLAVLLAFQGMLAGLALCIIPQKSHSSRRRRTHGGAFLYQADVSHMLSLSQLGFLQARQKHQRRGGAGLGGALILAAVESRAKERG